MTHPPGNSLSPEPTALHLLRLALGLNYFHFGFLKFYPDLSPAEVIASYTAQRLSLYWIDASTALLCIAILECAIGFAFLFNVLLRWVAPLFLFHMAATFLPLFLFPEVTFKFAPVAPTLEGQYILKNFVLVAAGWAVLAPHLPDLRTLALLRRPNTLPEPDTPRSAPPPPAVHPSQP